MSVIGRLWRRAPAWRGCVVTAVALTGLAAMFPPALPSVLPLRWLGGGRTATAAHYRPEPSPTVPDGGILHLPLPGGPPQQGMIHYAGRLVPLPAGAWQELVVGRGGGAELQQVTLFGRVVDKRLTGLVLVVAPGVMSGATGSIGVPPPCADPGRLTGAITPEQPGQSPLAHECWAITPLDMQATAAHPLDDLMRQGLARLGELHVAVPDRMLATSFMRSDDSGWLLATVLVPDRGGPIRKLQDWAMRFQVAIRKGYAGTLTAADLPPAVARDPG